MYVTISSWHEVSPVQSGMLLAADGCHGLHLHLKLLQGLMHSRISIPVDLPCSAAFASPVHAVHAVHPWHE